MQNDAKVGLLVGVGLVIFVAVVFFRKESGPAGTPDAVPASLSNAPASVPRDVYRPVKANPTASVPSAPTAADERQHVVREGETLFSLAKTTKIPASGRC